MLDDYDDNDDDSGINKRKHQLRRTASVFSTPVAECIEGDGGT